MLLVVYKLEKSNVITKKIMLIIIQHVIWSISWKNTQHNICSNSACYLIYIMKKNKKNTQHNIWSNSACYLIYFMNKTLNIISVVIQLVIWSISLKKKTLNIISGVIQLVIWYISWTKTLNIISGVTACYLIYFMKKKKLKIISVVIQLVIWSISLKKQKHST